MGLVNTVVPLERLEEETVAWCREMLALSPFALRLVKARFHAHEDGYAGIQQLAHDANLLFYASDEAQEGREAYKAKRPPDFSQVPPARLMRIWLMAARLRTLPAAVAPVLVGTSLAVDARRLPSGAFIAALLGAIFIQVGTNLSNDYSDARRGADTEDRLGPVRVTAGGLVPPRQVLLCDVRDVRRSRCCAASTSSSSRAGCCWSSAPLSILAGVLYTGGPRPYGYEGLGEVFVFLFFGIVAVTGSYFVQLESWPWEAFALAVPVGLLATAILVVNNIRDMDTDRRAGKRTLAVRLGRERARSSTPRSWRRLPRAPADRRDRDRRLGSWSALWWLLPWLTLPLAVKLVGIVRTHVDGPTLNGALARTGDAAARVLRAADGGHPASHEADRATERTVALRAPLRDGLRRAARAHAASTSACRATTA